MRSIAALIATRDRPDLLVERAAASVFQQTLRPDKLVVVNDGAPLRASALDALTGAAERLSVELVMLSNMRAQGAAGAWNTGLSYLQSCEHHGFVAILDDDDAWDADHLEANFCAGYGAQIVISGLRMVVAGRVVERPLISALTPQDFLVGNPGWQGSNTFIDLALLLDVGGFREGLPSLNDRDLAYRLLLKAPDACRFTGRWTSTWFADTPGNLSSPLTHAKRDGLRAFWALYADAMSPKDQHAFFNRAHVLFGFSEHEIRVDGVGLPPLGFPTDDSHD